MASTITRRGCTTGRSRPLANGAETAARSQCSRCLLCTERLRSPGLYGPLSSMMVGPATVASMSVVRPNRAARRAVKGVRELLPDIRRVVAAGDFQGAEEALRMVDQMLDTAAERTALAQGYQSVETAVTKLRAEVAEIRASMQAEASRARLL